MKYFKYIALIVFLTNIFWACSDDFLDTPPHEVTDLDFFTNEEAALNALTACYDPLTWYNEEIFEWFLGDIVGQDGYKGGEGPADWADCEDLRNFVYDATNPILDTRWKELYQGVYRCNIVITNVPDMDFDETLRNRIVGEAKFLRGYYYFQLVKTFGGVPLITTVLEPSEYNQPRAEISECWAQIEQDFKDAAEVLPLRSQYAAEDMGRATKGAAQAYLVKAYIYQQKWQLAEPLAAEIINSGEYDLLVNYQEVFSMNGENSVESIFELQFLETQTGWGDGNEGNVFTVYQGSRDNGFGWGFNCPTEDFEAEFEEGDLRREATIIYNGELLFEGTEGEQLANNSHVGNPSHLHNQKYLIEYEFRPSDQSDAPNNWRAYRYADLLLFHAEAAYHNGNDWQTSLNKVRSRVGLGESPYLSNPLQAIYHERRVELGMEGHRFWDVVRQGRGAEEFGEFGFVAGEHEYFPIPQSQIDLSGGVLTN